MSRPKPIILLSHTNSTTYKSEQILEAEFVYAVYYKEKPFNMRSMSSLIDYPGPKYKKSVFLNSGHAFNLAERLNKMFRTTDFEVFKLNKGEKIHEVEEDD